MRSGLTAAALAAVVAGPWSTKAQPAPDAAVYSTACLPVAQRAGREAGCWITAEQSLGELPRATPLHWHLDAYPSRAAAETAKGPRSTVVESLGRVWLFTVAEVGPLPVREGVRYVAQYMEGVSPPGARNIPHRHPGTEAWYNLAGRMCVETPEGRGVVGPGETSFVPEEVPHMLTSIGAEQRRSLVIVLRDASRPGSVPAHDWTPQGLCRD